MRRALGPTGIEVFPIGLGGMPLSITGRPSPEQGVRTIHAALDAGMTLLDTADCYCLDHNDIGHNERLIAEALRTWSGDTSQIVVATKGGLLRPDGAWTTDGSAAHLRSACEASLVALGVEAITLYQLHAPCDDHPFEESVQALADLQREGKIVHVGLSNVTVDEIAAARAIVPIVSVQNRCNPLDPTAFEDGVVDYCEAEGLAFLPYSPVGGGRGHKDLSAEPLLQQASNATGASTYEVALAWLLAQSPCMIPIPGARREASAQSSARAAGLTLPPKVLTALNAAYRP